MRLGHFEAIRPLCPRCASSGRHAELAVTCEAKREGDDLIEGLLGCPDPACRLEFPIIDGIPIIVPDVQAYVGANLPDILARDDLGGSVESLLGDAAVQGSSFETSRQRLSIYGWDGYGAHDPGEARAEPAPGAASRALAALLGLVGGPSRSGLALDIGCGVGATTFDLAAAGEGLVLGIDLNFAMLRLARGVLTTGVARYPKRHIGLVYERREFPVIVSGASRVDFWACDALALPVRDRSTTLITALNLLDCVPSPLELLIECERVLEPGGLALIASPYDWTSGATNPAAWIGGHSQRGGHRGAAEPLLQALLTPGAHAQSLQRLRLAGEIRDWPWQTRLHDRSTVAYSLHLVAARAEPATGP